MSPVIDFTFYWYAAHQFVNGNNPYTSMPGREYALFTPPWSLAILFPFGFLSLAVAEILWLSLMIALVSVSAIWLWETYGEDCGPMLPFLLMAVFTPIWATLKLGQTSSLVLFGLAGFLRYRPNHPYIAGGFLFFVAFKPQLTFLIWPALLLAFLFDREWKPLSSLIGTLITATLAALVVRPAIFTEYATMLRVQRVAFYETSTVGTLLRHVSGVPWLQFAPALFGLAWFVWHCIGRPFPLDWKDEMPMLVLVSLITTWYAWFTDELILIPAIFSATATIAKAGEGWERSALAYVGLNVAGMALVVGHHIYWLAWFPIAWLMLFFPSKHREIG